ncbi:hypothetical protein F4859DRAFT_511935 [Xylaria cf. heliscus]|nr:hypothetical protein F4859DRAFT_511935 [Xylaria cf. heliscus]
MTHPKWHTQNHLPPTTPPKAPFTIRTTEEQHSTSPDDTAAALRSHPDAAVVDYTTYSTKGLYGIYNVAARVHRNPDYEAEMHRNITAMEAILDIIVPIALILFIYIIVSIPRLTHSSGDAVSVG